MPHGSSQVVGLIHLDGDSTLIAWPSRPAPRLRSVTITRGDLPASPTECVSADVEQINADLKVELACVVARLAKARCRK